ACARREPGREAGWRGLTYLRRQAVIRVRKVDYPAFRDIPQQPLTDWQPDETTAPGIITCEVRDYAFFNFPGTVKDGLNDIPIPPGRYAIQMVVPNVANIAVTAGEA